MEIFGWSFKRKKEDEPLKSFTPEDKDDGAVVVAAGGIQGQFIDLTGAAKTEAELVNKYRDIAENQDAASAIDDICNEAIAIDEKDLVRINLDSLEYNESNKKIIRNEFNNVLELLDFNNQGQEIFRRWYVDGRLYYHAIINEKNTKEGIKEIRYIDPRKIRKVREIKKERAAVLTPDAAIVTTKNEYYIYTDKGFALKVKNILTSTDTISGLKIAKDAIVHVTSGLMDVTNSLVLSHLHKKVRVSLLHPSNQR